MPHRLPRAAAALALALTAACGGGSTSPSTTSYAGEWSGSTSQGTPFSFTVSADQKVTKIAFGYDFSGCAGTLTYSPDAAITQVPTAPVPVGTAMYDSGRDTANRSLISFLFTAATDAHGIIVFTGFGCGDIANAAWTATRR